MDWYKDIIVVITFISSLLAGRIRLGIRCGCGWERCARVWGSVLAGLITPLSAESGRERESAWLEFGIRNSELRARVAATRGALRVLRQYLHFEIELYEPFTIRNEPLRYLQHPATSPRLAVALTKERLSDCPHRTLLLQFYTLLTLSGDLSRLKKLSIEPQRRPALNEDLAPFRNQNEPFQYHSAPLCMRNSSAPRANSSHHSSALRDDTLSTVLLVA